MESLSITATEATPSVEFTPSKGELLIKGRSHPENSKIFYNPLIDWCEEYIKNPPPKTTLSIQLEHFNTISSKSLLDVFRTLRPIFDKGEKELVIQWFYEADDEELLDAGKTYQEITELPFVMIPY